MTEGDLDVTIRQIAKAQHKSLIGAAKKRHAALMARAARAKDKEARARLKLMAESTMLNATAIAKRLRTSAEKRPDSYARAMKKALEEVPAKKPRKTGET